MLVCSILMSVRNGCIYVHPKFSLEAEGEQSSHRNNGTHVKDIKNPDEVQPPGGDRLLVALRMVMSRDHILFTPLDDVSLDRVHSPD